MGKTERYLARVDGRILRALSHPSRVEILELLREDGPATASGLIADTERGSRRDRWWKAVHEGDRMSAADFVDDPDLAGPLNAYAHTMIERRYAAESLFVAEVRDWADEWIDKVDFHDSSR
ncbi:hypothetical protein ABT256_25625 [Amycolatopsis japonica]|uniref:hypothetical protein n=1 Tax=Amycolatopsis japonica TaxID=208439 RepID=UPI00333417C7